MQTYGSLHLIAQLTRREVAARYRGSALGWLWSVLPPLFLLATYTFVFSEIFKARWGDAAPGDKTVFALNVFAGMLFLQFFSECVGRAPSLLLSNANYVKKVVFPLPALPIVTVLAAAFNWLVGLGIWCVFRLYTTHSLPPTVLLMPLIIAPLALLTLGFSWMLAAFGAYLRDIGPIVQLVLTVLTFLSPVFYPVSALPAWVGKLLYLNPLTIPIEYARAWLLDAPSGGPVPLLLFWLVSGLVAYLGLRCFQLLRRGFADVL
jgi:lipopolysaccharide transport system permease protein